MGIKRKLGIVCIIAAFILIVFLAYRLGTKQSSSESVLNKTIEISNEKKDEIKNGNHSEEDRFAENTSENGDKSNGDAALQNKSGILEQFKKTTLDTEQSHNNVKDSQPQAENNKKKNAFNILRYLVFFILFCLGVIFIVILRIRGKKVLKEPKVKKRGLVFGNAQHVGTREDQQDSFGISAIEDEAFVKENGILAVVADGMGGLDNGREASSLVVSTMLEAFKRFDARKSIQDNLIDIVSKANKRIYEEITLSSNSSSGSTVVAVLIKEFNVYWVSVGDSRIYLYRNNHMYQLTKDHVYAVKLNQEAAMGKISFEEAKNNPNKGALTSYLGNVEIDEIDYNKKSMTLLKGDRLILCSDGVYNSISEEEMMLFLTDEPYMAAQSIQQKILSKNIIHQDNMTLIIIGRED